MGPVRAPDERAGFWTPRQEASPLADQMPGKSPGAVGFDPPRVAERARLPQGGRECTQECFRHDTCHRRGLGTDQQASFKSSVAGSLRRTALRAHRALAAPGAPASASTPTSRAALTGRGRGAVRTAALFWFIELIHGSQRDFELVELVPFFFSALSVRDRQQFLQTAPRRDCLRVVHQGLFSFLFTEMHGRSRAATRKTFGMSCNRSGQTLYDSNPFVGEPTQHARSPSRRSGRARRKTPNVYPRDGARFSGPKGLHTPSTGATHRWWWQSFAPEREFSSAGAESP